MIEKSEPPQISEELVKWVNVWLGDEGIKFFIDLKQIYGKDWSTAVWTEEYGGMEVPHTVHFREGMQIRNFLRTKKPCENWTVHQLDDYWAEVIERAIDENR